jgi:hypothetical protein
MLIKYVPRITEQGISDYIALVRWVGFTDEKIVTIPIDKIVTICNATPAFTKRYDGLTKTLKNSKQALPGFIERNMTDDELDQFADSDPNMKDIDKNDIKDIADLLKMPSKKLH